MSKGRKRVQSPPRKRSTSVCVTPEHPSRSNAAVQRLVQSDDCGYMVVGRNPSLRRILTPASSITGPSGLSGIASPLLEQRKAVE